MNEQPIIIGNAPSSGSTLLQSLITAHPNIFGRGELSIFDRKDVFELPIEQLRKYAFSHQRDTTFFGGGTHYFSRLNEYPISPIELESIINNSSSLKDMIDMFYQHCLINNPGTTRWSEKTPPNVYYFSEIKRLYPRAKFIHIYRDARDCVASLSRRGQSPFKAVANWFYATLHGLQHDGSYCLQIRYEDLVNDPSATMIRVFDFVGEKFNASILNPRRSMESLPEWRSVANSSVSTKSLGRHEIDLQVEYSEMLASVRLSDFGLSILPTIDALYIRTAADLQEYLGYSLDCFANHGNSFYNSIHNPPEEYKVWYQFNPQYLFQAKHCNSRILRRVYAIVKRCFLLKVPACPIEIY